MYIHVEEKIRSRAFIIFDGKSLILKKAKQNKTKQKQKTNKKMPAAMRHQHQMYMRFPHCTMGEMKKDKLAKD